MKKTLKLLTLKLASIVFFVVSFNISFCQESNNRVDVFVRVSDENDNKLKDVNIKLSLISTETIEIGSTNKNGECRFSIPAVDVRNGINNVKIYLEKDGYHDLTKYENLSTKSSNNQFEYQTSEVGKDSVITIIRVSDFEDKEKSIENTKVIFRLAGTDLIPIEKFTNKDGKLQLILPLQEIKKSDRAEIEIKKDSFELVDPQNGIRKISENNGDNDFKFYLRPLIINQGIKKGEITTTTSKTHNSLDYFPIVGHFKSRNFLIGVAYGIVTIGGTIYAINANNEVSNINRLLAQTSSSISQQQLKSDKEKWLRRRNVGLGLAGGSIVISLIHNIARIGNEKNNLLNANINWHNKQIANLVFQPSFHPKVLISF